MYGGDDIPVGLLCENTLSDDDSVSAFQNVHTNDHEHNRLDCKLTGNIQSTMDIHNLNFPHVL